MIVHVLMPAVVGAGVWDAAVLVLKHGEQVGGVRAGFAEIVVLAAHIVHFPLVLGLSVTDPPTAAAARLHVLGERERVFLLLLGPRAGPGSGTSSLVAAFVCAGRVVVGVSALSAGGEFARVIPRRRDGNALVRAE